MQVLLKIDVWSGNMLKSTMRPAVAMIELIFALVIMGIVMASAPMLISTATKSGYVAIQQEAINEAAAQVHMVMSYQWDEANTDEDEDPFLLAVTEGHADLDTVVTAGADTGFRQGTPAKSSRNFILSDRSRGVLASVALGTDGTEAIEDDIDDFNGATGLIEVFAATADYIDTINIATQVVYSSDIPTTVLDYDQAVIIFTPFSAVAGGGSSNIKSTTVTLTSTSGIDELDKTIILRGFSCNIAAAVPKRRSF